MRYFDGTCYRDMTAEELARGNQIRRLLAVKEMDRPLSETEILRLLIADRINTLGVDDNTALRMVDFYPAWKIGTAYVVGFMASHGGKLWRVLQAHTAQVGWEPENAPAMWEQIVRSYAGTQEDPIPYGGNLRLEEGKFYIQNDVIYRCSRDTGNPVYHTLEELVGQYVERI